MAGGTGQKFTYATSVIAGVASLAATLLSVVSIWFQLKNYRKPLLQRYVVRILLMVPLYSISSWSSMVSRDLAMWFAPIRDVYEAFTIYTFVQLLINYLGGERSLIIMTHGREPVRHLWPLNHVLPPVDISDPHSFLAIKRGILQYTWLKPILSLAAIIMKATDTYQEGYIGLNSGYFWSGIIYNVSVTASLYALGLFWVCTHHDLVPFRPVPKFLCIKLIIFFSYWQGFLLSILVWLGALPDDVRGYTPDNLAAAIQDFLICIEMPGFAIAHWYAFSWHDFADSRISSARMPVWYAMRDSFGVRDLIEDSKETFKGDSYGYRIFDSGDKIMAHEASRSRLARLKDGMRYERGGKGKYWIPTRGEINQTTPLLGANGGPSRRNGMLSPQDDSPEEPNLDADEELLYSKARKLEYGDWNYPVLAVQERLRDRYHSPRPSNYPNSPTEIFRQRASANSVPSLNPSAPLDRRRKPAPEGPQVAKPDHGEAEGGQQGQRSNARGPGSSSPQHAKDPLEIAYGPIVGTNPIIAEEDFEVDTMSGAHRPQSGAVGEPGSLEGDGSPSGEGPTPGPGSGSPGEDNSPSFSIGGDEEEFRNVWDR